MDYGDVYKSDVSLVGYFKGFFIFEEVFEFDCFLMFSWVLFSFFFELRYLL